jgi:hypothetical protein
MPAPPPTLAALRAKIARTQRLRGARHSETIAVRQDYAEAQLAEYVERIVSTSPQLRDDQLRRIAAIFDAAPVAAERVIATDVLSAAESGTTR